MRPEVSVIIPAYNSEEYLAKALRSVLNQSYRNLEVILIDDASTDSTVRIANSFQDRRLKIICNQQNRGVSYGRNLGIEQARGKWIALLDSDDWYAPERLEKLIAVAEKTDADLIADNLWLIAEDSYQHWSTLLSESSVVKSSPLTLIDAVKFVISDRLPAINAKRNWSLGYTKPLMSREFLLRHQIRYDEDINVGEDFTLYLECLRKQAKFYLLDQPYYYYRTREVSLSTRKPTEYLAESCTITESFINREVTTPAESRLLEALIDNLVIFQKRWAFYRLIEIIREKKLRTAIAHALKYPFVVKDLAIKSYLVLGKKLATLINQKSIGKKLLATPRSLSTALNTQWLQDLK